MTCTYSFDALENLLGYRFVHPELLQQALTHSSAAKNNNERIEFLGDAIVNFIIGDYLFNKFPEAQEGQLSRMRASLVKGEALTALAKTFRLSDSLIVGPGEIRNKGDYRSSILAGTMEAIIGAVYLDSDMEICRACIMRWYEASLKKISIDQRYVDPKTQLQELLQAKKLTLPRYTIMNQCGNALRQTFTVECCVEALQEKTQGQGNNRREAEQAAAASMIEKIQHDKS